MNIESVHVVQTIKSELGVIIIFLFSLSLLTLLRKLLFLFIYLFIYLLVCLDFIVCLFYLELYFIIQRASSPVVAPISP